MVWVSEEAGDGLNHPAAHVEVLDVEVLAMLSHVGKEINDLLLYRVLFPGQHV